MSTELRPRVRAAILKAFQLKESSLPELRMGDLPEWDSVGHMRLVTDLESAFGIRFPNFMLADITSETGIVSALQKLQKSK